MGPQLTLNDASFVAIYSWGVTVRHDDRDGNGESGSGTGGGSDDSRGGANGAAMRTTDVDVPRGPPQWTPQRVETLHGRAVIAVAASRDRSFAVLQPAM